VQCPLCVWRLDNSGAGVEESDDGGAWRARMEHVKRMHHDVGQTLARSRPDPGLLTYLWQRGVVGVAEYQELVLYWRLERAPAYTLAQGGQRDRRRGRRQLP